MKFSDLIDAVATDNTKVLDIIYAHPILFAARNDAGFSVLYHAIKLKKSTVAVRLIKLHLLFHQRLALRDHIKYHLSSDVCLEETYLIMAARFGLTTVVRALLESGCSVNESNNYNETALHIAAILGHVPIVECLLDWGASFVLANSQEKTALHLAAGEGFYRIVALLLSWSVALDKDNLALIKGIIEKSKMLSVSRVKKKPRSQSHMMLQKQDDDGWTALHHAAASGCNITLNAILDAGADVNVTNQAGSAVLHFIAEENDVHAIDALIRSNAVIDVVDNEGWTPLMYAVSGGNLAVAQHLVAQGANINQLNNDHESTLFLAALNSTSDVVNWLLDYQFDMLTIVSSLSAAIMGNDNEDVIDAFLVRSLSDVVNYVQAMAVAYENAYFDLVSFLFDQQDLVARVAPDGSTVLHLAARNGHYDIVMMLLDSKYSVIAENDAGEMPVYLAARNCHYDILTLMFDFSVDSSVTDAQGNTLLHAVLQCDSDEPIVLCAVIKFLIDRGVSFDALNGKSCSALDLAKANSFNEAAAFLSDATLFGQRVSSGVAIINDNFNSSVLA